MAERGAGRRYHGGGGGRGGPGRGPGLRRRRRLGWRGLMKEKREKDELETIFLQISLMEGIRKPYKNHCLCTPVPLNKTEDTKDIIFPAYSLLFALKAGRQTGVVAKMRKYARYPSPFSPLSPLPPLLVKHVFGLSSSLSIETKTRGVFTKAF